MCKEDIRIKRKTATNTKSAIDGEAVGDVLLKSRPDRVTLILACSTMAGATIDECVSIGYSDGGTSVEIASVGPGQPSVVLTIEQIGTPITFPIILTGNGAGNVRCSLTEVFFNEELKDL